MKPILKSPWFLWTAAVVVAFAMAGGMILKWRSQSQSEREFVHGMVTRIPELNRDELAAEWHVPEIKPFNFKPKMVDRLKWDPSSTATLALAIMPRNKAAEFDAIYALYEGDQARAVLAITPIAEFVNGQEINPRRWPEHWVEQPLQQDEIEELGRMRAMLEGHAEQFDPQSPDARWTRQVVDQMNRLIARQPEQEQL